MNLLDAPADIANLYPRIDDWTRAVPWRRSTLRRDYYQTTYKLVPAGGTVAVLKPVNVFVHRNIIKSSAAAWDIARQITTGRRPARERQSASAAFGETTSGAV